MSEKEKILVMAAYEIPEAPWGSEIALWKQRKYATTGPSSVWSFSYLLSDFLKNAGLFLIYDKVVHDDRAFKYINLSPDEKSIIRELQEEGLITFVDYSKNINAILFDKMKEDFYSWTKSAYEEDPDYEAIVEKI